LFSASAKHISRSQQFILLEKNISGMHIPFLSSPSVHHFFSCETVRCIFNEFLRNP
jgi:hypothetical protein